ncbi:1-aminocyclopropane-1-carboxylate deaminase/D-cysteine desulfhydrase [Ulvibacter litoralis]|uniref:1-aminocyclopropane-1-carboxylate deaminase n=1 Tax=Ulvibacter litoralis TaxID=227084 RepID=A0A1G7GDI2_9FLAO|nr:pyridoxal-phosphate dependent enzyme [Ulvibacter litoralis]GHC56688.1 1-aminocyclopropane-1-carboxylate deaminase [Ulvibacter litoralis]SDE86069.1 1-aminocyclopropane-1-carboxylate deaminase [Ulvibacter litoralis]
MIYKIPFFQHQVDSECQQVAVLNSNNVSVSILREDKIHPFVSGNKYRKLFYNIKKAEKKEVKTLLTFGGAYSNHIAAVAAAGKVCGFHTIGVIRGEELANLPKNETLAFAEANGMQLHYVSREEYRLKEGELYLEKLKNRFGNLYIIPEGGTNTLAVKGCETILSEATKMYDYICVSVGTGGTISGLINASEAHQTVLGFSALKGTFQKEIIQKYTSKNNYNLIDDYCFGGYAKIDSELIRFINTFKEDTQIPLDPIYTGKMMFGVFDLLKKGYFKENSRILAVHTGGLQGIAGMNQLLKKKNLPQISVSYAD